MDANQTMQEIRFFVYGLFQSVEKTHPVRDQMEEMIADLSAKTQELMNSGKSKETALEEVFGSLGNTGELLGEFRAPGYGANNGNEPPKPGSSSFAYSDMPITLPKNERRKKLTIALAVMLGGGLCCNLISIISSLVEISVLANRRSGMDNTGPIHVLAFFMMFPFIVANVIGFCFFMIKMWEEIPRDIARTTPHRAAGFSFIPFFNLYWYFVAWFGLVEDMNRTAERYGNSKNPFNANIASAVCVFWAVMFCLAVFVGLCSGIGPNPVTPVASILLILIDTPVTIIFVIIMFKWMCKLINMKPGK